MAPKKELPIKYLDEVDIKGKTLFIRVDFNVPWTATATSPTTPASGPCCPPSILPWRRKPRSSSPPTWAGPKGKPSEEILHGAGGPPAGLPPASQGEAGAGFIGPEVDRLKADMEPGDVLLLENLRFHPEEEKNDPEFAKELMKGVDVYVNDAFAVATGPTPRWRRSPISPPSAWPAS
jgi:phosphoglycerate kinase